MENKRICGLKIVDGDNITCHLGKGIIADNCEDTCLSYIPQMMDDEEPFSPEHHQMALEHMQRSKGMQNIMGISF